MSLKSIIRSKLAHRLSVPEIPVALTRAAQLGFNPQTIFDVGAYQGDFARLCLGLWPQSRIACFEALPHKVTELRALANRHSNVTVVPGLLGDEPRDSVPLHEGETASSVLDEHTAQNLTVSLHPMRTIDGLVASGELPAPDFLKLDVQGYELAVLKGAEETLPRIQMILAEINLLDIHKGVPLLADIVGWLAARGWSAYDICGLTRRPLDQALWQCDMLFVPMNSPLRADKRWGKG